ncbi:phage protein [Streptococcus dysgalactiae subsp. equisimilis]|nr:phage protein [Streptococcus dysgalactiae subsp. equisimilis]
MFTIDYSKAKEFASITDGTYETIIEKAVQDATKNGADFINIHFRIRKTSNKSFKIILFSTVFLPKKKTGISRRGHS